MTNEQQLKEKVFNAVVEGLQYPIHENAPLMRKNLEEIIDEAIEYGRYLESQNAKDNS
jgi:hypothetical protein